jgi:hypothetical protein
MRQLQLRLQTENPRYRRVWVQYSNYRQLRVLITLFPQGSEHYKMVFGEPRDLSYESINDLLQNNLVVSN